MGSDSNFCNCKNLSDDSFSNMICPTDYSRTSVKKEFITNSINKNISKEELIKSQAVNKIIRNYRNYIKNKTTKEGLLVNDYSNNNNSENEDKIKSYKNINFLKNSNYLNDNNTLEKENDKNDNTKGLKKIKYNKNIENISDRLKNSNASLRTLYIGGGTKDQKEGFGINIWLDDAKYIGYFKNNKAEGYGKFIGGNDIYLGEFKEDAESGFGIFTNEELTYEGYWENDKPETIGEEIWTDGALYRGEYHMGQKKGVGMYSWPDGTRYEGEWDKNTFNGFGIFYFAEDKYYLGEWKDKNKHGLGEFIWPEKKFIGYYINNKREGFGITIWKDGKKAHMGFWKDGNQLGFGKFMKNDKIIFGIWKGNKKVHWFKNENEGMDYLENNGLNKYKNIFEFDLAKLYDFCYNNDDSIENILLEREVTNNNDDDDASN